MNEHIAIQKQRAEVVDSPLWWLEAPPAARAVRLPTHVDVVIVGSGFTGLSAALTIARNGRSVVVCDAGAIGSGASGRNGGFVGAKLRRGPAYLSNLYGEDQGLAISSVGREARSYIEDLIQSEQIDCDFETCTRFQGAHKPQDFEKLRNNVAQMRKLGFDLELVDAGDQKKYVDSGVYHGGLVDRGGASFHPSKYVQGLLSRAEAAGAVVASHTRVIAVGKKEAGRIQVRTANGTMSAVNVIIATNGYTDGAFPYLRRRIIPIGSYIISTEQLSPNFIRSLMPGCDLVTDTRRCASYMRTSPDKTRILYGGRVAATDISAQTSAPRLKQVLTSIFPALNDVRLTHCWMGFTGFTFDELPHLGSYEEGVYYAMGYCGSGTSMATYLGHKIALQVLGDPNGKLALDELEFPKKSWYRGNPWFLSSAIAVYRILDRLHM